MEHIGRYEVKGELGRGGMAIVYRAIDPQIGREVAIKVLPREFMQEADFLSRFQREVRTVGQLTHAAIVPLYDAGQDNGQPYLVMRLMGGGSLLDRVRRGALSLAEVVAIFNRLAGALDEAHRKGVIHRDLKPGNILLDEVGLPYLSDFGIVKLTDATSMTSRGAIGTPAYMSPEHFHGKVNARSDVYAMGIILFQLLTGKLPFQAQTPPEYMRAHFMDVPPPLRSINPNLPVALEPILQRALAKSDEARYASVGELARALSEAVSESAGPPVSRPASQPYGDRVTVPNTPPPVSRPASQPFGDRVTVPNTPPPSSSSVGQRSANQPVSVQASFPWLWVGAGGVVMVLLLIILGLVGLVASRGTAVVERVVTATLPSPPTPLPGGEGSSLPSPPTPLPGGEGSSLTPPPSPPGRGAGSSLTPPPSPSGRGAGGEGTPTPEPPTSTPIPQIIADSATDTPIPPTSTPKPTETRIPPTETPSPPTPLPKGEGSQGGMVRIPAGEFIMGSTQAQVDAAFEMCKKSFGDGCDKKWFEGQMPQHTVNLGEYYIDQHEVVNAEYAKCVTAGKCTVPHETKSYTRDSYYNKAEFANYPVIYVDWTQAKNYCEYVGKRLPTEAEWEKAARGTDGRIYPWGNEFDGTKLNFCDKNCSVDWADKTVDDGYADTSPVGSYELGKSVYGVYDLSGNVWEWTSSDYKAYPYIANDGREELLSNNNKVFRGGSWNFSDGDTRAAFRSYYTTTNNSDFLGFRCAQ